MSVHFQTRSLSLQNAFVGLTKTALSDDFVDGALFAPLLYSWERLGPPPDVVDESSATSSV
ncbi:hypothetical protein BAUCODRAFT_39001 [Baudoinia panamericana UAMH 10762]|uniref:Uncharacterized protein n=1 Tax=Baudoinia panamericana (strain UAMH 10762) TaxID=717646 RepID=M2M5F4_BAUPA|nr:uncharacterized protein BAUCODRAFT_39001 [Baudoinia panamericana UAMH 10762]EMC91856.1 hypothetical protein BAUCODRAFT_39001 [Baudoinia panamericana UAMH 10762]